MLSDEERQPAQRPKNLVIADLPAELVDFSKQVFPQVIAAIAQGNEPWSPLPVEDLQLIVDKAYPSYRCVLTGQDAPCDLVSPKSST
jgi:hypothetical protein